MAGDLGSQVADTAKDVAGAASGSPLAQAKLGMKVGCLMGSLLLITALIFFTTGLNNTGVDTADASEDEIADVTGDVEFWFTTYDPAKGGINGRDCGGAVLRVCSDSDSPTGYVGKYNGKVVSNGVIAVPQDSKYHSGGHVDINQIPVPLIHSKKVLQQAKIIIPGYNKSEAVFVGDHFASMITKPNRVDLACKDYCPEMVKYMKKNKLILDRGSGYNGGTKVLGKVVGDVVR